MSKKVKKRIRSYFLSLRKESRRCSVLRFTLALMLAAFLLTPSVDASAQPNGNVGRKKSPELKARKLSEQTISDVTNIHLLRDLYGAGDHGLLILRAPRRQLGLYRLMDGKLRLTRRATPWAFVSKASSYITNGEKRIAVGYDYTATKEDNLPREQKRTYRKKLPQRLRVALYDLDLDNPELILDEQTDDGEFTFLDTVDGKLFAGLRHSGDFSKGGYLLQEGAKWKLFRQYAGRYQEQVAASAEAIVLGRSMRDAEEEGSELQVLRDGMYSDLPSNKGVTAVALVQADIGEGLKLLAADGLSDTRFRRGRSALALFEQRGEQWTRRVITSARKGDGLIDKLLFVNMGGKPVILAKGFRYITLYRPDRNWSEELLYRKHPRNAKLPIDVVCLKASDTELILAVLEAGEVSLLSYRADQE